MLETERRGRVLVVRVNHPPHNFMTAGMVRELDALTRSLRRDRSVGAVVITGKPGRLFITHYDVAEILDSVESVGVAPPAWLAGALLRVAAVLRRVPGLRMVAERTPLRGLFELYRIHDVFLRMNRMDKAFVAAINGPATGGGCELALACDWILASENAVFGQPEVNLGIPPGFGGTQRLPRKIGPARALELLTTARQVKAVEAAAIGLANHIYPASELMAKGLEAARTIAAKGPAAVRLVKQAVLRGGNLDLFAACALESDLFAQAFGTQDSKEGMDAFLAKRTPRFKGS